MEVFIPWFVYMIRLANDSIYVGSTQNLERRFLEHLSGSGCKTTSASSGKLELIYSETCSDQSSAHARERQLKGWTRAKKIALAQGQFDRLHQLAKSSRAKS